MSKIQALINYLEIDSEEIEIIQNGNSLRKRNVLISATG
jgi:hypothetical protein